jgi:Protein of unknown function (DUF2726)
VDPTLIAAAAAAVLGMAVTAGLWHTNRQTRRPPVERTRSGAAGDTLIAWPPEAARLMNDVEQEAYTLLRAALPNHLILAHVPVSRFVRVPTRQSYAEWMRRIGHTCVDLLVCDSNTKVLAVVDIRRHSELIDSERQQRRRERLHRVLTASGITVQVWREGALPHPDMVARSLLGDDAVLAVNTRQLAPTSLTAMAGADMPRPHVFEFDNTIIDLPGPNTTWYDEIPTGMSAEDLAFSPTVPEQIPGH